MDPRFVFVFMSFDSCLCVFQWVSVAFMLVFLQFQCEFGKK